MLQKAMWLALAGACGTVSRFALCEAAARFKSGPFPLGTFLVNILGSFLFGLIYAGAQSRFNISVETRAILLTGFLGAFTTFSAFAFDTAKLLQTDRWALGMWNVAGQVIIGVAALVVGVLVARAL